MGKVIKIEDIKTIFNVNNKEELMKLLDNAMKKSINQKKVPRNSRQFTVDLKRIKKYISGILLVGAGAVGALEITEPREITNKGVKL